MRSRRFFQMITACAAGASLLLVARADAQTDSEATEPVVPSLPLEGPQPCLDPGPLLADNGVFNIQLQEESSRDCRAVVRVIATASGGGQKADDEVLLNEIIELRDGEARSLVVGTNRSRTLVTRSEVLEAECSQREAARDGPEPCFLTGVFQGFIGDDFVGTTQDRIRVLPEPSVPVSAQPVE